MTGNCAHRGASAHAPENTLAALRLAIDQGADMAEMDVQLSADGVPVLMHDVTVDRTTDGQGPVADLSREKIQRLDAGSWFGQDFAGEKAPTLDQVLGQIGPHLRLNIELKGAAGPELENAVVGLVRCHGQVDRCLLTSFDHARIDRIQAEAPDFKVGYIVGREQWQEDLVGSMVGVLSLERSLVAAGRVAAAHQHGQEIHVWTVNAAEEMTRLLDLGVDAIITNCPDRLAAIQRSR